MSKARKQPEASGGAPEWMTTYGDLVTLLMCFFVLLFAFSTIDNNKFTAVIQSFKGSAGVLQGGESLDPSELVFDGMPESKQTLDQESLVVQKEVKMLEEALDQFKEKNKLDMDFKIEAEERGIKISFPDNVLFDPGQAIIKDEAKKVLDLMVTILNEPLFVGRNIVIEGHTDNVPINSATFPTNWELSGGRAVNVLRSFVEQNGIDDKRISYTGYGEYRPVASNETAEGRAQNRRVDIIILTEAEESKQPSE